MTPSWYHPVVGLGLAIVALTAALPDHLLSGSWKLVAYLLGLALPLLAMWLYRRLTGVWLQGAVGPRTKRLLTWWAIALLVLLGGSLALYLVEAPWLAGLGLAAVMFAATILFGRHYDNVLRAEIREDEAQ